MTGFLKGLGSIIAYMFAFIGVVLAFFSLPFFWLANNLSPGLLDESKFLGGKDDE